MLNRLSRAALATLLIVAGTLPAHAIDPADLLPVDEAFVLEAHASAPGEVTFRFRIAPDYYLYQHRFSVEALDAATSIGEPILPPGQATHDQFFGDVEIWRGAISILLPGVGVDGAGPARFKVGYQGCADLGVCYPPQSRELEVELPQAPSASTPALPGALSLNPGSTLAGISTGGFLGGGATDALPLPAEEAFQFEAIANSPVELLLRYTPAPGYYLYRDRSSFRLLDADGVQLSSPQWPTGIEHWDEHFGDVVVFFDQVDVPLGLRRSRAAAGPLTLEATFQGCQDDGICYPPMTRQVQLSLPEASADQLVSLASSAAPGGLKLGAIGWLEALLLALGGGLILNLMPCVLPILSLKALSLAESGSGRGQARSRALWYTAGVLLSFAALGMVALGLRQIGLALGWGFQLQQPLVVAGLAYVMIAIGLSLSGVFSVGGRLAGIGQGLTEQSGAAGDFFTGVLAVVVASPCTAPLMTGALAFAFAAPTGLALTVFLALGLGLALPFLMIGFIPALARRLPRPGAWMDGFKKLLAFPMYLTAVWLLWVLGQQRGVDAIALALVGAVLLGLALWRLEAARFGGWPARALAVLLLALAFWPLARIPAVAPSSAAALAQDGSVAYSAVELERLRQDGRTVFLNMTADWCVTCKANEKRVLDTAAFRELLTSRGAVHMKGDWTNVDPEITAFLEDHGAVGVPLYVVVRPGHEDVVLPTVLSFGMLERAFAHP